MQGCNKMESNYTSIRLAYVKGDGMDDLALTRHIMKLFKVFNPKIMDA